jgi:hypothetical protein
MSCFSPKLIILILALCALALPAGAADEAARLAEGWRLYRFAEFKAAVAEFEGVLEVSQPGSDAHARALYGLACCWSFRQDARSVAKGAQYFEELLDRAPGHELAPWAALDKVRARYLGKVDAIKENAAEMAAYRQVWERYPATTAGQEAFIFQGQQALARDGAAAAERVLAETRELVAAYPRTAYLPQANSLMANCCRLLDRQEERLHYMIQASETRELDLLNPNANKAGSFWAIAYAAEFEAGNFTVARTYYGKLIQEYPKDLRIFAAREALKRMDAVEAALREGRPLPVQLIPGSQP